MKKIAKQLTCRRCGNRSNDREAALCPFCHHPPYDKPDRISHAVKRYPQWGQLEDDEEEFGLIPPQQATINMKVGDHGCTKCQGFVSREYDIYSEYLWCSNCGRSQEVLA